MKTILLLLVSGIVFLFGCKQSSNKSVADKSTKSASDSITIVQRPFRGSNELIEYEIPVITGTSIKQGIQKRFYRHGSLYSSIPYVHGKREGIAYTYYSAAPDIEPPVWKEQSYKNNELDGVCKRYHKNGTLQAEYEFKNGNQGVHMKEYTQSGKPVKQPTLTISAKRIATGYYIQVYLSNKDEKVDYFIGNHCCPVNRILFNFLSITS